MEVGWFYYCDEGNFFGKRKETGREMKSDLTLFKTNLESGLAMTASPG